MVREDEYCFLIIAAASADATSSGEHLVDEGKTSTAGISFNDNGTSTGGNRGLFPDDDHESVEDPVPSVDEVLYPMPVENA